MNRINAKLSALSIAIAMSLAAGHAMAAGGEVSGSIGGAAQIGGQYTVGSVSANESVSSQTQGNAVSATKVYGPNAFSTQSTVSTGEGSATAGLAVTPSSVTVTTGQTAVTNVVSNANQSAQLPTLDNAGLLVNGTAGVAQVTNNAAANATQTFVGQTGYAGIEGSAGIQAVGETHGF